MIGLLLFVLAILASPFKSKSRLEAENAALRHQLVVLRRKVKGLAWFLPASLNAAPTTATRDAAPGAVRNAVGIRFGAFSG